MRCQKFFNLPPEKKAPEMDPIETISSREESENLKVKIQIAARGVTVESVALPFSQPALLER